MRTTMSIAAMVGLSLVLAQCSSEGGEKEDTMDAPATTDQMESTPVAPTPAGTAVAEEREIASSELKGLRDEVEERINDVDNRLQRTDLTEQTRKAVESERTALLGLRERIDRSLEEVEGSDASTWANVKGGVNNTVSDVRDWFKKMGEKVDNETKADADKDGH